MSILYPYNMKMIRGFLYCSLVLCLVLFAHPAHAEKSGGAGSAVSGLFKRLLRVGFGYGFSEMKNVEPTTVTNYDRPETYWQDADFLLPVAIHLGIRETMDRSTLVNFKGQGSKQGELYLTTGQLGAKLILPFFMIQPWVGGGFIGGFLAVTDPTNRNAHNWTVIFDRETKATRGMYWHAGLDIMFGRVGLRVGVQGENMRSDNFHNLQQQSVKFNHTSLHVGAVGYAF